MAGETGMVLHFIPKDSRSYPTKDTKGFRGKINEIIKKVCIQLEIRCSKGQHSDNELLCEKFIPKALDFLVQNLMAELA